MKSILFATGMIVLLLSACNTPRPSSPETVEKRDTTITTENAYTELFFDSTALEKYLDQQHYTDTLANQFRSFYNTRNYQYAWFFGDGPAEQAYNFLNLQSDYIAYSGDSTLYNAVLQQVFDTLQAGGRTIPLTDSGRLNAELSLTFQFFKYAGKAYLGNSALNTNDLKWFIPRKKIDIVATLDSLIKHKGGKAAEYEPVNPYYLSLKNALLKYYEIEKKGGWKQIVAAKKQFLRGDTGSTIIAIKQRLLLTGDFIENDSSALFTDSLTAAVKNFQRRYGMKEDGIVSAATIKELNQPIHIRIRQMLINLERMRWVPDRITTDYLLVNIPEFRLHVFEKGNLNFSMNVVVGSGQNNTVIFYGDLRYVVFSPYWNIPPGILKKEVMPGMARDPKYLAKHNMEVTGYAGSIPNVRQKPGPNNSLGKVKFLFPNSYSIYMHDTPSKSLFGETKRAFSHGCIRLNEPQKLAEFLLRNDSSWTTKKISAAMNSGKEKYVTLPQTVPVFISYFTAWVDSKGQLNFRDDVYGHDARTGQKMFE